ncbi:MAG: hypothetical protein IK062_02085 [Selenomonadaceae bacterium]|nr:hypothetical protein [Selenomonadaceae bacterium]
MIELKKILVFLIAFFVLTCNFENVFAQSERGKSFTLQKGDCIGILAPSGYLKGLSKSADFKNAVNFLEIRGYRVKLAPSCDAILLRRQ